MRTILHSDLNSCYASIEALHHPELRDAPLAVGGSVEQRHGIILAKNDHAKRYGVHTGEALWQARQKCPGLVILPPDFERYWQFCSAVRGIYGRYTDLVEPFGLDECWLDVSGSASLFGGGAAIAQEIRRRVKKELGVTVSVGVSFNKIFAKLGSDMKKPDAVTVVTPENFQETVWPLPAADLLYVGPATRARLARYGIATIGQLACASPEFLRLELGKMGAVLSAFANGLDRAPVAPLGDAALVKSVGNGITAPRDLLCPEDARIVFTVLCESVAERMRELGFVAGTVQIGVRDSGLYRYERQCRLPSPTALSSDLRDAAMALLEAGHIWTRPIRSLEVRGCGLSDAACPRQTSLYRDEGRRQRQERLEGTVDALRCRFGRGAIRRGNTLLDSALGSFDPRMHTIHPVGYFK